MSRFDPSHLTYLALQQILQEQILTHEVSIPASLPNLQSALNLFLDERKVSSASIVGTHLRSNFERHLQAHTVTLNNEGRPRAYIHNRRTLLRHWRRLVARIDSMWAATTRGPTPLQTALKAHIMDASRPIKPLARDTGVPLATLRRWLKGGLPQPNSVRLLKRLETHLALPPGELTSLVVPAGARPSQAEVDVPRQEISYRSKLRDLAGKPYAVQCPEAALRQQWMSLLDYKVAAFPPYGLQRNERGRWRAGDRVLLSGSSDKRWFAMHEGRFTPTAARAWKDLSGFLGFLSMPRAHGGLGLAPTEAHDLAQVARAERLNAYVRFRAQRAGGRITTSLQCFTTLVASLLHPQTGYVSQQPQLFCPDGRDLAAWHAQCAEALTVCRNIAKSVSQQASLSRDPFEPIRSILARPLPLDAVAEALQRMRAALPALVGPRQAALARDIAMLALLSSNPIRLANLRFLTFQADGRGQLRKTPQGGWHIRIESDQLKNHQGAGRAAYDMPVQDAVTADLDAYVLHYRALLPGANTNWVFLSQRAAGSNASRPLFSRHFFDITRTYFADCPGFAPHAMRHIVATSILKAAPDAWDLAARVLHDNVDTVRAHYGHLSSADTARQQAVALGSSYAKLRR